MFASIRFEKIERVPVIVLGVFSDAPIPSSSPSASTLSSPLMADPAVAAALRRREWTGAAGSIVEAFPNPPTSGDETASGDRNGERVLIVGLGTRAALDAEKMRDIAAKVGRRLAQIKEPVVSLELASTLRAVTSDEGQMEVQIETFGRHWGESLGLLAWKARTMQGSASLRHSEKSEKDTDEKEINEEEINEEEINKAGTEEGEPAERAAEAGGAEEIALTVTTTDTAFATGLEFGLKLAISVNLARTLSQTPPNIATPFYIAEQAILLTQQVEGLICTVLGNEALEQERLTGLITVGKASVNPPCLIRLAYIPAQATDRKPLVLLGKTITYDTGGLSLKINNGMVGMKRDKDGGCAVLGAMHAVATVLKPDFPVIGLLVAAENMVSDAAFRPDDVLTYRNGVTVEVTNTDAEGRLVLADGLIWACSQEHAGAIVDLATLTGGVVTALGSTYAGMFCQDDGLRGQLEQASLQSGERVWRLPMHQEYRDMLKSTVADIINSNANRKAHPIQGAAFLSYFVTEGMPWAHIDIAGVHAVEGDSGPFVKGPTGYGVRLLADLVTAYARG